jgi:hypothetical protein
LIREAWKVSVSSPSAALTRVQIIAGHSSMRAALGSAALDLSTWNLRTQEAQLTGSPQPMH